MEGEQPTGWFAESPINPADDEVSFEQSPGEGSCLRFMGEYGVAFPLWGERGPIENADTLRNHLGLSEQLIADLADWAEDWDLNTDDPAKADAWWARRQEHQAEAHRLVDRLNAELAPRFSVVLVHDD